MVVFRRPSARRVRIFANSSRVPQGRPDDGLVGHVEFSVVDLDGGATRGPTEDDPPLFAEAVEALREGLFADGLHHHINPFSLREVVDRLIEGGSSIVDCLIGAEDFRLLHLFVVSGGGNDAGPAELCDLNRGGADPASRR